MSIQGPETLSGYPLASLYRSEPIPQMSSQPRTAQTNAVAFDGSGRRRARLIRSRQAEDPGQPTSRQQTLPPGYHWPPVPGFLRGLRLEWADEGRLLPQRETIETTHDPHPPFELCHRHPISFLLLQERYCPHGFRFHQVDVVRTRNLTMIKPASPCGTFPVYSHRPTMTRNPA
jgi:hypothetical protein